MRKTIDKLQADPSKAEEIQFLNEIAESIPDDAYLKGLFTERFVNFIAQKITDDWYCDFMDMYQSEIDNASNAETDQRALQKDFENYVSARSQEIKGLNVKIESLSLELQSKADIIDQMAERRWELIREHNLEKGDLKRESLKKDISINELEGENERLQTEILKLKAKMFDMQEKIDWLEEHTDYDSIQED